MENTSKDMIAEFNELKSEFIPILDKYLTSNGDDKKKLSDYVIENSKKAKSIKIKYKYLEYVREVEENTGKNITKVFVDGNLLNHISISISHLIELQTKKKLSESDLLDAYDSVYLALDSFSQFITTDKTLIETKRDWVVKKYNTLQDRLYGTKTINQHHNLRENNTELRKRIIESICNNGSKIHSIFNEILSNITEKKKINEKIKAYIDDAFIFLLLVLIRQRTNRAGLSLDRLSEAINEHLISKAKENGNKASDVKGYKEITDSEKLVEYLLNKDIVFWDNYIIDIVKEPKYESWNIPDAIPGYITRELKSYRNEAAHSTGDALNLRLLIRTLRAMISFTKNLANIDESWNVETSLLEKRLFFEICNENKITRGEKLLTNYGNIKYPDITNLQQTKNKIECWKNILKTKTAYDYMSPSFTVDQKPEIIARAVTQQLFEECTEENEAKKKNAINQIESFYSDNSIFFPFWINDIPFRNLLEAGYPFHPMFFIFTKKLPPDEVIQIAKDCIWNALSSSEQHPLIMPYDIDINECMKDTFINYYTAGKTIRSDFTPEASTNYFEWLYDFFYKEKSEIWETAVKEGKDIDATVFSNVCKTIVMLSVDEMKGKYYDSPSRFWIRLCCCHPNESIVEVEKTLDFLDGSVSFYFSLPQNPFQLIKPLAFKELMKKMFVYVGSKTDNHTLSDTELKELEMTISNGHIDLYKELGYLEISLEGYNLIKDILSEENDDLKNIKNRLTSDEILYSNNFLEKYEGKIKETSSIRINDFPDDELNYFCSLYGKCDAGLFQNEMILEAQIKQYSRIAWYYCQSSGVPHNYQFR